jgi:hypothetical protein
MTNSKELCDAFAFRTGMSGKLLIYNRYSSWDQ